MRGELPNDILALLADERLDTFSEFLSEQRCLLLFRRKLRTLVLARIQYSGVVTKTFTKLLRRPALFAATYLIQLKMKRPCNDVRPVYKGTTCPTVI